MSDSYTSPPLQALRKTSERDSYSSCLIMAIICDLTISASMVYFLNKMRTGFKNSENVINRLVLFSINVGLLTTTIAACTLITYLVSLSLIFSSLHAISGKSMDLTQVTLNSRVHSRGMLGATQEIPLKNLDVSTQDRNGTVNSLANSAGPQND
ncbi:hypothetical protein DXG01_012433 [Tephrocybe rancida]|nr:hypothetical protein DXG01_012433 [Tephrocybe rancida]